MSVAPATSSSILVVITGVTQNPTTYSVVGTTLTFSTAPPSGTANISVRYLGIPASGVTTTAYRTLTEFTATASQTTFTPPSYTVGFIAVYQNGVMLGSADYTASNGTTVVLAVGALVNDLISTESFYVSSVLNAIPATAGAVNSSYIASGITLTSPTLVTPALGTPASGVLTNCTGVVAAALPAGTVLQVVSATKTDTSSFTSSTFTDIGSLTVTITPRNTSSKFLVVSSVGQSWVNAITKSAWRLMRDATPIAIGDAAGSRIRATGGAYVQAENYVCSYSTISYLDSPATASAVTYKCQASNMDNVGTVYVNRANIDTDSAIVLRTASSITVFEIAG